MHPSAILAIDEIGDRILNALKQLGWDVWVETDYPRQFKEYQAYKRPGILDAFVIINVVLMTLDDDPNNVDIVFFFYADPNITGRGRKKIPFGKKARANDAEVFRRFCDEVFKLADLEVEFQNWESETSPRSPRFDFKGDRKSYEKPAYVITLNYWKKPIEESIAGLLALKDRVILIEELAKALQKEGYKIEWKHPITGVENRHIYFYVKQDSFKKLFEDLLAYKDLDIEINVKFDGIEIYFYFDDERLKKKISLSECKTKIREKLDPILKEFPEFKFSLNKLAQISMSARFPLMEKDRVIAFFRKINELKAV